MRVKNKRAPEQILRDIPPPLQPLPIMILIIHSVVTLRTEIGSTANRSIMTGGRVIRPMLRSRDWRSGQVVLPLFQESTKEGVLTYTDWRGEVKEYITKGYSGQKIKDAMFTSLEGKAKRNYQECDKKGDLTPKKILEKMDMIYGTSVSFRDLNAKLCGLKQGEQESPKDYYEQMVNIKVALKEYHGDQFKPGELA